MVIKPAISAAEAGWLPLKQQWAKPTGEGVPQVRWWIEAGRLLWEVKMVIPRGERAVFPAPGFVEGLWEQDVAEFFIADRATGHYQEFNLGPGGAWWSATFSAPRVRIAPQPECRLFGITTNVSWTDTQWIGRQSLPLPDLAGAAVNFTAIIAGPDGRRFYSLADLGGRTPDFHRPADWIPL